MARADQPDHLLISLFTSEVNIYEVQNNGNWYDFGFILGVAMAFGGGAVEARKLGGLAVGRADPARPRSWASSRPPVGEPLDRWAQQRPRGKNVPWRDR